MLYEDIYENIPLKITKSFILFSNLTVALDYSSIFLIPFPSLPTMSLTVPSGTKTYISNWFSIV